VPSDNSSGDDPQIDAKHFYKCKACGEWVDDRDLAQVMEHEEPLPHAKGGAGRRCVIARGA
jgi:hypothetical protein